MHEYRAVVTEVFDGDTITVNIDLGFNIFMDGQKIRLNGIDAPEMRGASKEDGIVSRDYLRAMVLGKPVTLRTHKAAGTKEKYGRWLADVTVACDNCPDAVSLINVNDKLVAMGMAERIGD